MKENEVINLLCDICQDWKNNYKEQLQGTIVLCIFLMCVWGGVGVESFVSWDIWFSVKMNSIH